MVSTASNTEVAQTSEALSVSTPTPVSVTPKKPMICPRCEAMLQISYEEPECLQCGYVDYSWSPDPTIKKKKSIVSTGTHYILRYVGDFKTLSNVLTHVKLRRERNRVVFGVACPFCNQSMEQSSLSGKRREVREERYKCVEGHRVSLMPDKTGKLGWK